MIAFGTRFLFVFTLVVASLVAVTVTYLSRRQREHAGAKFTQLLLHTLRVLEQDRDSWQEPNGKAWFAKRLEEIASCVEDDFLWSVGRVDTGTYEWFQRTLRRKATAIRELKKWVLNPKADTHAYLTHRLSDLFVRAAEGDLDSVEMAAEDPAFTKTALVKRFWSFVKVLPSAVVPAAVVWIFHRARLLTEPLLTYLVIGSFIWVCLTLMSAFDPHYSDRLDAFRKLTSSLPFFPKDKDKQG